LTTELVSKAGSMIFRPLQSEQADSRFRHMLSAWLQGAGRPLPLALATGFAAISGVEANGEPTLAMAAAEKAYEKELEYDQGYLQRAFADFSAMAESPEFRILVA